MKQAREARIVPNTGKGRVGEIEVLVSERKLRFVHTSGCVIELPVGTARPGIQFYGLTRITKKRRDPTWIPTPNQRRLYRNLPTAVPPGPRNPLGSRALNLAQGNLRIHGTNEPYTIGSAVSDGCIRMFNAHIEALFELVKVGALVTIRR